MSWVNDKKNVIRDYFQVDELCVRPIALVEVPGRDRFHGRAITAFEEAVDSAFFNANVKGGITKYKTPQDCPVDYLSMLSIEHGVHGWYQGDSEQLRRDTISAAKGIHKKAGTIGGLTEAINSLGLNVIVTPSAAPYTLVLLSDDVLTPDVTMRVMERAEMYKSEKDYIYIESKSPSNYKHYRAIPSLVRTTYFARSQVSE